MTTPSPLTRFSLTTYCFSIFKPRHARKWIALILSAIFLFSDARAQNLPSPSSCTSKDLELVGASLPPPSNDLCACGGTRTLMLTINNKTGSTRTSFALWGTLKIFNSEGTLVSSENIFACAATIPKSSTTTLASSKQITFTCGQSLVIENLFLAWTSASPGETCSVLESSPSTIAPKCGTLPSIRVLAGVNADLTTTDATCSSGTGSISVSPYGGQAPYSVTLGSTTRTVAAGGSTTFSNLSGGSYTIGVTDSRGCSVSLTRTVKSPDNIAAPTFSVDQPTCAVAKGTVTITNFDNTITYELKKSGVVQYTADGTGKFTNVDPDTYQLVATKGVCSQSGSDVTVNAQPATPAAPGATVTQPTCAIATGTIEVTSPLGSGITYSIGGGYQSSTTFANVVPGNYSITAKSADGCISASTSKTVNQQPSTPAAPAATVTQPTCAVATGTIEITSPLGSGLTYSIGGGYQSSTTFSNVVAGDYTITVKSVDGCISPGTNKSVLAQPSTPDAPAICVTQPSLCGPSTGTINVLSPVGNDYLYSKDGGQNWQSSTAFTGLAAGSNPSIIVKNTAGCISNATNCDNATTCDAQPDQTPQQSVNQSSKYLGSVQMESSLTVKVMPNPFSNNLRFTINTTESGTGTLDLYNALGQKVKTVYQGYIPKGSSYFDLKLAGQHGTSTYVYVLTMGNQRISGKLIQNGN